MARTLSQDLGDRLSTAIERGMNCRSAAAHLDVSISSAIRWRSLALHHGRVVAKPRGSSRHSGRIEAHGDFIKALIAEPGHIILVEVEARLYQRGVPVGIGTVHRFFARRGMSRKKIGHAIKQDQPDILRQRQRWFDGQLDLDPTRLVFIDGSQAEAESDKRGPSPT